MFISVIQKRNNTGFTLIKREKDRWRFSETHYEIDEIQKDTWAWPQVKTWLSANPDADIFKEYTEAEKIGVAIRVKNVEVFRADKNDVATWNENDNDIKRGWTNKYRVGWYYWWCVPGCLPDSDPYGPYSSERQAWLAIYDQIDSEEADKIYREWREEE